MVRWLAVNPILVGLALLAGWAICAVAGVDWYPRDARLAAGACLLAAELSVGIVVLQRPATTLAASQTALISLGLHLLLSMVLSIIVLMAGHGGRPFVWWALALFWTTLSGVGLVLVICVRRAAASTRALSSV